MSDTPPLRKGKPGSGFERLDEALPYCSRLILRCIGCGARFGTVAAAKAHAEVACQAEDELRLSEKDIVGRKQLE